MLLVMIYGTCIPSTGRRCLGMDSGLVPEPPVRALVFWLADAVLGGYVLRDVLLGNMLIWLTFASAIAVYGSHKLSALRREILAARRLGQYRFFERPRHRGNGRVY